MGVSARSRGAKLDSIQVVEPDILIRTETPADVTGICHVTKRAFAGRSYSDGNEQDIVNALGNEVLLLSHLWRSSEVRYSVTSRSRLRAPKMGRQTGTRWARSRGA